MSLPAIRGVTFHSLANDASQVNNFDNQLQLVGMQNCSTQTFTVSKLELELAVLVFFPVCWWDAVGLLLMKPWRPTT